jgi:hypothetical protein
MDYARQTMKKDRDETPLPSDAPLEKAGAQATDFVDTPFGQIAKRRKAKRRNQQTVGIAILMSGYMSLAVTADSDSGWLLIRVVGGFALLFTGFAVAIGPTIATILGDHD